MTDDRHPSGPQEFDETALGLGRPWLAELGRVDAAQTERLAADIERVAVMDMNGSRGDGLAAGVSRHRDRAESGRADGGQRNDCEDKGQKWVWHCRSFADSDEGARPIVYV